MSSASSHQEDTFVGKLVHVFKDLLPNEREMIARELLDVARQVAPAILHGERSSDSVWSGRDSDPFSARVLTRAGEDGPLMLNVNPNDIKCPSLACSGKPQEVAAAKPKRRVKAPRNYFMVNLSDERIEKLRALSQCAGTELRFAFRGIALVDLQRELELDAGVSIDQAFKLTRAQRKRLGATRRSMLRLIHPGTAGQVN